MLVNGIEDDMRSRWDASEPLGMPNNLKQEFFGQIQSPTHPLFILFRYLQFLSHNRASGDISPNLTSNP